MKYVWLVFMTDAAKRIMMNELKNKDSMKCIKGNIKSFYTIIMNSWITKIILIMGAMDSDVGYADNNFKC